MDVYCKRKFIVGRSRSALSPRHATGVGIAIKSANGTKADIQRRNIHKCTVLPHITARQSETTPCARTVSVGLVEVSNPAFGETAADENH